MRVVLTDEALADLDAITDYIAQDNPRRAISFGDELINAAAAIGETPQGFAVLPEFADYEVRRKPYRSYSIFYRIVDDRIDVIHILHSAQNYQKLLFPEEEAGGPE